MAPKTIEANKNIAQVSVGEAGKVIQKIIETMPAEDAPSIVLIGPTGMGKTETLQSLALNTRAFGHDRAGLSLITRHMSQVHPLDMGGVGLDNIKREMYFARPPLHLEVMQSEGPRLLLLDEIDRAAPMAQNALLQVLSERKQNGYKLEDTYVVAAANAWHAQYTFELDKAAASRLAIMSVMPKVDEWLLWAANQNVDSRVLIAIANCPDILNQHDGEKNDGALKLADPRAWKKLSDVLKAGIDARYANMFVGEYAAQKFQLFVNIDREYAKEIKQVASGKKVTGKLGKDASEEQKILFAIYFAAAGRIETIDTAREYLKNGREQIGDEKTYIASRLITYKIPSHELCKDPVINKIHSEIAMATLEG